MDGSSSIEMLVAQAAMLNMPAIALTDHNTIAGLPSFHKWANAYGVKPVSGAELTLDDGSHLTVLVETKLGYQNLCQLLTIAYTGAARRKNPRIFEHELFSHSQGLILLSGCRKGKIVQYLLRKNFDEALALAKMYEQWFPNAFYLEIQSDGYPGSKQINKWLTELGEKLNVPIVATSDVHYTSPHLFPVHDILRCMSLHCDVKTPHALRPLNHLQWLHSAEEARRRFENYQGAIMNTHQIANRCEVVLPLHQTCFPKFVSGHIEQSNSAFLRELVLSGVKERYQRIDQKLLYRLEHELDIISRLGYVDYFLVVWDIVRYARERRIRCAGRGSAADSAVAYCLYITDVDAAGRGLLFERFMSLERAEKPDIDIDFDSARRDEVIQYVYEKYGADHVARIATYQTFQGRSAIREIGSALAIPSALLDALAKRVPWMAHADGLEELFERIPEIKLFEPYRYQLPWLWKLAREIAGFPRHFGMHSGGIIINERPLWEITSLQPSAKGEWMTPFDKYGVEEVGLVKLDLLSLKAMSAVEGTIVLREKQGQRIDYDSIPFDDKETFEMIQQGETVGVFQLESPAQRSLQARLHALSLEDIVASVALIRPGPIQGNMVDPFLNRRSGHDTVTFLHPKLKPILEKTYGVVLFQEQVIEIATVIAKFTPGEADKLRRVMSHARSIKEMNEIGENFIQKARCAGIDAQTAEIIFSYIQGYAGYGFCEAHAAAFAATAYKTAFLVRHYPAWFYASILNQYPMGFYPVHVICAEARRRGIEILGVDINHSEWNCKVPNSGQIRLGFRMQKGFSRELAEELESVRTQYGEFTSIESAVLRIKKMDHLTAERLIRVGAFDSVHKEERNELLWQLPAWFASRNGNPLPLFAKNGAAGVKMDAALSGVVHPNVSSKKLLEEKLEGEYNLLGVGVSGHWLDILRLDLKSCGYVTISEAMNCMDGSVVKIGGLSIRPHRPPTKSGKTVVFFTLEDETAMMDVTMFESVYRSGGAILFTPNGRLLGIQGTVSHRGGNRPGIIATQVWPLSRMNEKMNI